MTPCIRYMHNQSAMTFIEVMLALLLFSVGILAVAALQITSFKSLRIARASTNDTFAVSERLELLYAMPSQHAWLSDPDQAFEPHQADHGPVHQYRTPAYIEWEIGTLPPVANARRIAVTLHRRQAGNRTKIITYESVKAGTYASHLRQ